MKINFKEKLYLSKEEVIEKANEILELNEVEKVTTILFLQQRIDKAIEYIENYDVFKEFSFPLMKRDEENQVKSSIKYQFDTSINKDLLEILKGDEE